MTPRIDRTIHKAQPKPPFSDAGSGYAEKAGRWGYGHAHALAYPAASGYNHPMTYNRTQHGRRHNVLFAFTFVSLTDAWLARGEAIVFTLLAPNGFLGNWR